MESTTDEIKTWRHYLQDEADAAFLYRQLSRLEPDKARRKIFCELAEVEDRHTKVWVGVFLEHGIEQPKPSQSIKARLLATIARRFGPTVLLPYLLREEGQEVKHYLNLYSTSASAPAKQAARRLARESSEHAVSLGHLTEMEEEPWHHVESGDLLRNFIYGFNDGLTANFGLVAGLIGAAVDSRIVLITGLAGTLADALSMGASGYLAAKSKEEVHRFEIDMERQEIELMPELEEQELALIYRAKGMDEDRARQTAREIINSPENALEVMSQEELHIAKSHTTPIREGWITGSATAVGALIPVLPFLLVQGPSAIWLSFGIAMLSHFAVGAARSFFTGLNLWRSGFYMFAVGIGVAAVGYFMGDVLIRLF